MYEVVIDGSWGGFTLTKEMVEYMSQLGSKKAKNVLKKYSRSWEMSKNWEKAKYRYDPYLIQMVKDLKPRNLIIEKIKSNKFVIHDYDGSEYILTPENIDWHTIK
jgi:hypothetical protein